jgi:hypothetical protein
LKKEKAALIGLILPFLTIETNLVLALLPLTNITVSSAIAVDKLILLMLGLSPLICILGGTVSIIAFVKSEMKITAFVGAVANIALLIFMVYFSPSFAKDFGFAG